MKILTMLIGGALTACAGFASAQSQPNPIQGTPNSLFPYAAPNEVQIINGVPCRTVLVQGSNMRVPVECAGQVATGTFEPSSTGSIRVEEGSGRTFVGRPISGTPNSIFPYAAPNEVQIINGVPCRTILVDGTYRVPVECAH
ncbi:hypothetical protein HPT29_000200 [Microvirga terrae]|uniref:Uncharacterized protein n=1 Tax=Microvirga terrae TaxID=2740529 RepID=A0ABY5RRS7_9HYPH|nr:hypothetical protein [Microvirga terrae]UVF19619.1 hypothetical protein HPT29_000200 [Microvirga terrae]